MFVLWQQVSLQSGRIYQFPGNRSTQQQAAAPDFERCSAHIYFEIIAFWSIIIILIHIAIHVFRPKFKTSYNLDFL